MTTGRMLSLAPLQLMQAAVGFGALAAFTRLMSAEEFGRYALALSLSMAAHAVLFTWAEAAAFRFYALSQAGKRAADHFATLIAIALALGLITLLATGLVLSNAGFGEDVNAIAAFAAAAATLRFITRIARESERAALSFKRYAILETAYLALGFTAGIAFLLVFDLGSAAPFAGLALGGAVIVLIDAPRLYRLAEGGFVTFSRGGRYAAYGAPLALALGIELGVQAIARILLAVQTDTASVGAYAAAFGLARGLDIIFLGLSAAFAPLLLSAYETQGASEARKVARDAFVTLAAIAFPACVGLAFVAEPLSTLMIGESLRAETAAALPWLALAGLFSGFTLYYWSEAFQLAQRTGLRALLMLAPGVVQLGATVALAPQHGAVGAAIAAAASAITGCCLLAVVGRGLVALPVPAGALVRTLAATAVMSGGLALLPLEASLVLQVVTGASIYAIAAIALDVLGARGRASAVLQFLAHKLRGSSAQILQETK